MRATRFTFILKASKLYKNEQLKTLHDSCKQNKRKKETTVVMIEIQG